MLTWSVSCPNKFDTNDLVLDPGALTYDILCAGLVL